MNPDIKLFALFMKCILSSRTRVNGKKVIKYFGCNCFKPVHGGKQISPASNSFI
jgi:hypothetical protein